MRFDRIRWFIHGRIVPQGERYEIVPGGWRLSVWRPQSRQLGWLLISLLRPFPCRPHRWRVGPVHFRVASSMGHVRERVSV